MKNPACVKILLKVQVKIIFFKKGYLKAKCHLIFNVFTCVCPKLALKIYTSHSVCLLWLVLVQRIFPSRFSKSTLLMISLGVCVGLCFSVVGSLSACSSPMVLARFLEKMPVVGLFGFFFFCALVPFSRLPLQFSPVKPHV